jgi:uncharacterized protein YraI
LKNFITRLLYGVLLVSFSACQAAADSAPRLTVREATNCRTGPGIDYDIVVTYPVGTQLEIAGRAASGDFWLVKSAESSTGLCWMWGESVDVSGNTAAVPGITVPATAISVTSDVLIVDQWEYSCDSGTLTFILNWRDRREDESGYRIFRNGELLIELPAGSNAYTDTVVLTDDPSVEYYLQAFGSNWTVNSAVMKADC